MFFSIIMPYYKNSHIVKRSVESVLAQTIQDFELIIVDDGSEDNIDEIIQTYNNLAIKVIHKENGGVSSARNCGILNASGNYICFLDSDDAWYPEHLEELQKMIVKYPQQTFFLTSHLRIGNKEVRSSEVLSLYDDIFLEKDFLGLCFNYGEIIHTNSVCMKKDFLLQQQLFDAKASIGEDTDLWFRCAMKESVVISKKITTIYYRDNSVLTKDRKFNYNWPFLCQYEKAQKENMYSVKLMCDQYFLAGSKHMLADGNRLGCKNFLMRIDKPIGTELKKAYLVTKVLYLLPCFISKKICRTVYDRQLKNY